MDKFVFTEEMVDETLDRASDMLEKRAARQGLPANIYYSSPAAPILTAAAIRALLGQLSDLGVIEAPWLDEGGESDSRSPE